jgi:hypothetical protein
MLLLGVFIVVVISSMLYVAIQIHEYRRLKKFNEEWAKRIAASELVQTPEDIIDDEEFTLI